MLLRKDNACLVLVDVQEKLSPHVMGSAGLIDKCHWLMRLAERLSVPVLVSEQYAKGLGRTVEPLRRGVTSVACDKVHFSCYRDPGFVTQWQNTGKQQVVLMGIETHVCVLQTALDMHDAGIAVYVVVDAVSSRDALDHQYGLARMQHAGVQLVTSEMVFFEWVEQAGTPAFKALSKDFLI